ERHATIDQDPLAIPRWAKAIEACAHPHFVDRPGGKEDQFVCATRHLSCSCVLPSGRNARLRGRCHCCWKYVTRLDGDETVALLQHESAVLAQIPENSAALAFRLPYDDGFADTGRPCDPLGPNGLKARATVPLVQRLGHSR